ncbi:uncharacterized protein LOC112562095 [Pomacea canaliculata]|uniref:uncharacterized protein LOC112562095 n=1 Tax=Pomacea canaliculata TaxID=400727 RepID=UPI000D727E40|nr:uncharacterized protein LOC112562095 [Pomacea canaliculata]
MVAEKDELLRKRVLYIGSAVPLETADGLDGIQQPLRERYPVDDDNNIQGILSFISILPTGIQLQYVSDPSSILSFPIQSLTLCAAVRCVTTVNASTGEKVARFVSLSSPAAGGSNSKRPAIFTAITRRTEGRKVLECHGFICASSKDALELVQSTAYADRLCKGKVNGTLTSAVQSFHIDSSASTPRGGGMMHETNTLRSSAALGATSATFDEDLPLRLVPGENVSHRVAPEFFEPPPSHGYFYKTKDSQIKTYAVERVTDGESERLRAVSPPSVVVPSRPASERRVPVVTTTPLAPMTLARPATTLVPVRGMATSTATLIRPRFFSPPPPVLRQRPVAVPLAVPTTTVARDPYVFLPPAPTVIDVPYVIRRRPTRRDSDSSSRGSSRSSSPATNGRRLLNGDGAEGSSDVSSRPRTPPTDYEHGPRVSRREQFDRRKGVHREVNGEYGTLPVGVQPVLGAAGYPYDYYVYPSRYSTYGGGGYPPYVIERARSVPPPADRGKSKDQKKSRKTKEKKKQSDRHHRMYGVPSDISTDSVGYMSEAGPVGHPRMPRDFRRAENQFKHERAFSKSLAEENRGSGHDALGNAYSLNEHMSERAAVDHDFNMY